MGVSIKIPQDHKKSLQDRMQDLDTRRQGQIENQVASINRLLKDGSYDNEMAALHEQLAEQTRLLNLIKHIAANPGKHPLRELREVLS